MRRKPGAFLPIERSILVAAIELHSRGEQDFYGYGIAREMRDHGDTRRLAAHGTLYRALDRLETFGLLESHWEDPQAAADEHRPLRRLYQLTAAGERAGRESLAALRAPFQRLRPGSVQP